MVFMPHWPKMLGSKPINLGLERILQLMERLGNPHLHLPPVIHVAGTNGKGSTVAMMRSILKAAGYKVHSYTSPHLLNFNERIKLNGVDISDEYLTEIMEECNQAAGDDIPVTFFEGTTAGAFLAFSRNPADVVLLETGLGGRLDATNIIPEPALTIITPISLDHTEYLGPNISVIAGEKAGIIKPHVPCIISMQYPEVMEVLLSKAEELASPTIAFEYDWMVTPEKEGFIYQNAQRESFTFPRPALLGEHQLINAGTAIAALEQLKDFSIPKEAIDKGLKKVKWPGRLQQLTYGSLTEALPEGWEIWLDGAHNEASAHVLARQMEQWQDKPLYVICGITRGRDPKPLFSHFAPHIKQLVATDIRTEPSATSPKILAQAADELGIKASAVDSIEEAIQEIADAHSAPGRIIVCGSLYLVSDALSTMKNN